MMKQLMLSILCLILGTGLVLGQEESNDMPENSNGITAVSYYKCDFDKVSDAIQLSNNTAGPILDRLVDEGKLTSWGVLTHLWGDEWNLIMYFNAQSVAAYQRTWDEMLGELMEEHPDFMESFSDMCSEHKDNIYNQVRNYSGN